jgi:hypothetical protein
VIGTAVSGEAASFFAGYAEGMAGSAEDVLTASIIH